MLFNNWIKYAQSVLYPPTCVLCGDPGAGGLDLCRCCREDLPYSTLSCRQCALPLESESTSAICGVCQKNPPHYQRTTSLYLYAPPVDRLITQLKFNHKLENARLLGTLMAENLSQALATAPDRPECIIPVPLHKNRIRQRGYNQALELARPIARRLGIALDLSHCRRQRETLEQSQLAAKQRRKNVRGAFELQPGFKPKHVAIVDDVMTTGQTVGELARLLTRHGVQQVDVWVCARAVLSD